MDYITAQTPDKGVQIGPEPPISNDSIALTPDKGVQIGKELPIINASIALTPDKGVQIGPEPPISNDSIAMVPDKGVQVGPELPINNDSIAMASDTIPGFAGNLIEAGIALNGTKSAVYKSTAYPANADGTQRPGAVVEYSSKFSVGEGFSVDGVKSELPAGYIRAEFLESVKGSGKPHIELPVSFNPTEDVFEFDTLHSVVIDGNLYYECKYYDYRIGYGVYSLDGAMFDVGKRSKRGSSHLTNGQWGRFELHSTPARTEGFFNGERVLDSAAVIEPIVVQKLWLFRAYRDNGSHREFYGKKKYWKLTINSQLERDMLPALSVLGEPCMYDKVHKESFVNVGTGSFVVGFTLEQARKLGAHLPAGGGSLTISLPEGYDSNAGVMASLEIARLKGWTLTIQTYTPETATETATTFALKRIWVRKTQDDNGAYIDTNGSRWQVDWCVDMITPDGSTPDDYGYELFRNIDAAVAYWELTPYVDPEAEEEFLQEV